MTTIDTAAAWRVTRPTTLAALTAFLGLALGGCESAGNIFGTSGQDMAPALAQQATPAPAAQMAKVAIAPVIGAPDAVAKQMQSELTTSLSRQKIGVASGSDKAEYTLRGYVVSAKEKTGSKISYIWDVTDPTGKRVNRITGEELVPANAAKDPWAAVTPQIVQSISEKTASSLAAWLPTQGSAAASSSTPAPSGAGGPPANTAAPVASATPAANAKTAAPMPAGSASPAATATAPSGQTTGSIDKSGAVTTVVPSVTGAPGDGSTALSGALQRELQKSGVAVGDAASGQQAYRVEGKVVMGQDKDGKQPIQIDWNVKDPAGKRLGTVSQKNEVPQGSLDGQWGKVADAAAAAAAQGILKLLPQAKTN